MNNNKKQCVRSPLYTIQIKLPPSPTACQRPRRHCKPPVLQGIEENNQEQKQDRIDQEQQNTIIDATRNENIQDPAAEEITPKDIVLEYLADSNQKLQSTSTTLSWPADNTTQIFIPSESVPWLGDDPPTNTIAKNPNEQTSILPPAPPTTNGEQPIFIPYDPNGPQQYTPPYSKTPDVGAPCMESATLIAIKSTSKGDVTSHAPNDIGWISQAQWQAAAWDGVPYNTCGKTKSQISAFIFPNPNTMRGIRELFYQINPFADNVHPTIAEIDNWHVEVIKHFRRLIGAPQTLFPDRCLFLRAHWNNERMFTRVWDTPEYPGTCYLQLDSDPHCGATFTPSCTDQIPYFFSPTDPCCPGDNIDGSEGIFTVNKDIPWSIKLTRVIAATLSAEGLGGHTGPFVKRKYVGLSFICWNAGSVVLRAKWSGPEIGITCP